MTSEKLRLTTSDSSLDLAAALAFIAMNPISAVVGLPGVGIRLAALLLESGFTTRVWVSLPTSREAKEAVREFECRFPKISVASSRSAAGCIFISVKELKRRLFERTSEIQPSDCVIVDLDSPSLMNEAVVNLLRRFQVAETVVLVGSDPDIHNERMPAADIPVYTIVVPRDSIVVQYHPRTPSSDKLMSETMAIVSDWVFSAGRGNLLVLVPTPVEAQSYSEAIARFLSRVETNVQIHREGCPAGPRQIYVSSSPIGDCQMMIDLCRTQLRIATPLGGERLISTYISQAEADQRATAALADTHSTCYRMCTPQFFELLPTTRADELTRLPMDKRIFECIVHGVPVLDVYPRLRRNRVQETIRDFIRLGFLTEGGVIDPVLQKLALTLSLPMRLVATLYELISLHVPVYPVVALLYLIDSPRLGYFKPAPAIFPDPAESELYLDQHTTQFFSRFIGPSSVQTLLNLQRIFLAESGDDARGWCRLNSINETLFMTVQSDIEHAMTVLVQMGLSASTGPTPIPEDLIDQIRETLAAVYYDQVVTRQPSTIVRVIYADPLQSYTVDDETIPTASANPPWYLRLVSRFIGSDLGAKAIESRQDSTNYITVGLDLYSRPRAELPDVDVSRFIDPRPSPSSVDAL